MKIIIAGCRWFEDYDFVKSKIDATLEMLDTTFPEIVSGCCNNHPDSHRFSDGVDGLGERYADEKCFIKKFFPADWDKYGNAAGPVRNRQMAEYADALIAFWDGKSKGTKNMIREAFDRELLIKVYKI